MIAPAVRPDFVVKLPTRNADAVFLDCEDAVPANAKEEGRLNARRMVPDLVAAGCQVVVRVNPVSTEWFEADIATGVAPEVAAVVLPKVESLADIDAAAAALQRASLPTVGVVAGLETALGVADARQLLAHPLVVGAYFGAEDFIADMGGVRTQSNAEVHCARSGVALAGRLAGVPTLDQVVTNFGDSEIFELEAAEARNMGYAGKMCIHPAQVELANKAFIPSAKERDRARRLLDAYETASRDGLAAINFEGQMVDEPLAAQARRVLTLQEGNE